MGSLLASNAQENWSFVLYYYAQLDIQTLIFSIYFRNNLFNIPHIVFTTFHTGLFNKFFLYFMWSVLKYISYTVVQSFSQVDPFLLLILFENLRISGHFFMTSVLVFHYIGKKLPYFTYFAQKSQKIAIL